jgi:hypothetical protein
MHVKFYSCFVNSSYILFLRKYKDYNNTFKDIAKISANPFGNTFSEISFKTEIKKNTTCGVILQWHFMCTTHPH